LLFSAVVVLVWPLIYENLRRNLNLYVYFIGSLLKGTSTKGPGNSLVGLILTGSIIWWLSGKKAPTTEQAPPVSSTLSAPTASDLQDTIDVVPPADAVLPPETTPSKVFPEPLAPKTSASQPANEQPSEEQIFAQLDLANFADNPMLDGLIGGELRSGLYSMSISFSSTGETLLLSDILEVLVFDNKELSFIDDEAVIWKEPSGEEKGDGYAFLLNLSEVIVPGRHYILVLDKDGELLVGGAVSGAVA
jgi:hypothetical protein